MLILGGHESLMSEALLYPVEQTQGWERPGGSRGWRGRCGRASARARSLLDSASPPAIRGVGVGIGMCDIACGWSLACGVASGGPIIALRRSESLPESLPCNPNAMILVGGERVGEGGAAGVRKCEPERGVCWMARHHLTYRGTSPIRNSEVPL